VALGDKQAIEFFYSLLPNSFEASTIISLARSAIESGEIEAAEKFLIDLKEVEKYHPEINNIELELSRCKKVKELSLSHNVVLDDIDRLSGLEFEELVIRKFRAIGLKAEGTSLSGDFGADVIVETKSGTRIIIQCKRFKNKVNIKAVQEVLGALNHFKGDYAIVITNNDFLNSAIKLAKSSDVELWGRDRLIDFLSEDLSFSVISDL
jgi:HJR/Mrr/RecB family endonuclease